MRKSPLVSVIIPIYDAARYLRQAVDSILNQSFKDFELIAVYDHSHDDSLKIISSYQDSRVVIIKNDVRQGIVNSLNIGLSQAKGKYIMRMDADDIALRDRIQKQVSFLEKRPDIDILSGNYFVINQHNKIENIMFLPLKHEDIVWSMSFYCPFCHPLVVFRRNFLESHKFQYTNSIDDIELATEDFALWYQMLKHGKAVNLDEPLLYYRNHSCNISLNKTAKIEFSTRMIATKNMHEITRDLDLALDYNSIYDCFHSYDLQKVYDYKEYVKAIGQVMMHFRSAQNKLVGLNKSLYFARLKLISSILRSKIKWIDKLKVLLNNYRILLPVNNRLRFALYCLRTTIFYSLSKLKYRCLSIDADIPSSCGSKSK